MKIILIVDDNKSFRESLSYALASKKRMIITASSTKEAINILKRIKVDFVVSDYDLPNTSGLDILKFLKFLNDNVPFVLLTGLDNSQVKSEVQENQDYFIDKSDLNLVKKIKNILTK